jgi:2-C-methyl-D-erythritol 4-phosphate cytidylyltransferase
MTVAALVLGAGSGSRLRESWAADGAAPKAFVRLAGKSLMARSIDALCASGACALIQPVLPASELGRWSEVARDLATPGRVAAPVAGGATRQASAAAGLAALPAGIAHVAVHDAARPLVRPADVARVVAVALEHGAALLATRLFDTIHRVQAGCIAETPLRAEHWAAQTPQVFRIDWLRDALAQAARDRVEGTDDAGLVARLGLPVHVVEGDAGNLKITRADDLALAEQWLARAVA